MRIVGETIGSSPFLDGQFIAVAIETLNYNGYVIKMNKETGEIIWRTDFLGEQSHSSPALSMDKKILSLGANNDIAFGIDYATGKIKWKTPIYGKVKSTPTIVENNVLFTTRNGELINLDITDGHLKWKTQLGSGSQVSPTYLENKKLIIAGGSDGALGAYELASGKTIWKKDFRVENQTSSPVVIKSAKTETILVACADRSICYLDSNGKEITRINLSHRFSSSPLIWKDSLYLSLNEGGLEAYSFVY
jgi:outer membrane protein assembly factor BamB